jgi:hypothetical protein
MLGRSAGSGSHLHSSSHPDAGARAYPGPPKRCGLLCFPLATARSCGRNCLRRGERVNRKRCDTSELDVDGPSSGLRLWPCCGVRARCCGESCLRSASVDHPRYGFGPADLAEPVDQLAALVLTREPATAMLHCMAEAVPTCVLRSFFCHRECETRSPLRWMFDLRRVTGLSAAKANDLLFFD